MTDDLPRILSALEKVDGVTVTSAWPREPPAVPVVLVTLAGERAADRRDDRWYLTELEYYVRVFAAKSGELRRVVAAVDDAMRALGGMEQFVKNGWAGKDYTHINYAGGRRVAWALFDAINAGVSEVYTEQRIASLRRTAAQAVLDSARRAAVDRSILPSSAPLNPRAQ